MEPAPVCHQQGLNLLADAATAIACAMAETREGSDSVVFFIEAHSVDVIESGGDQLLDARDGNAEIAVEGASSHEEGSDHRDIPDRSRPYAKRVPPSVEDAKEAYDHLSRILKPPRNRGRGLR